MKRKIKLYIGDMLENIALAQEMIRGMDYSSFVNDRRTNYAVIRCIEIIGEAAKRVPDELRRKYAAIPWKEMAGMRDMVVHFYMGIDYEIVWRVVTERFPHLKPSLEQMYAELDE